MKELPKIALEVYTRVIEDKLRDSEQIDCVLNEIFNVGWDLGWLRGQTEGLISGSQRNDIIGIL